MTEVAAWASPNDGADGMVLRPLQEALPIRLIATPRERFSVCSADELVADVIRRNVDDFDYFPVIERRSADGGEVIGLFRTDLLHGEVNHQGMIAEHYTPLCESNIIGADASLLDFVRSADKQGCRLLIAGASISGLVSLSDLQQLPVRAALFAAVTHLEMRMTQAIRRRYVSEAWRNRLNRSRRRKLEQAIRRATAGHAFVDALLMTQFCDKRDLLAMTFPQAIANEFVRDLEQIEALRNKIAHANEYASTRDEAVEVCQVVRTMDRWNDELTRVPSGPIGDAGE